MEKINLLVGPTKWISVVGVTAFLFCLVSSSEKVESDKDSVSEFSPYVEKQGVVGSISKSVETKVEEVLVGNDGDVSDEGMNSKNRGIHESYFYGQINTDSYMFTSFRDKINGDSFEEISNGIYTIKDVCNYIKADNFKGLQLLKSNIRNGFLPEYKYLLKYNFEISLEGDKCNLPDVEVEDVYKKILSLSEYGRPKEYPKNLGEDVKAYNEELEVALANKDSMYTADSIWRDDFRTIRFKKEEDLSPVSEEDPMFRCKRFESFDDVFLCRYYYLYSLNTLKAKLMYADDKVSIQRSISLMESIIRFLSDVILNQNEDFELVHSDYLKKHRDHYSKYKNR